MRSSIEEIGAIVPENGGGVVLRSRPEEEIEIFPASCSFGCCRGSGPFSDYEGNVCEVSTHGGDVSLEGCFVGVRAPDCLAPCLEDKVVYILLVTWTSKYSGN